MCKKKTKKYFDCPPFLFLLEIVQRPKVTDHYGSKAMNNICQIPKWNQVFRLLITEIETR